MGCHFCRKKGYQRINYLAPDEKEIPLKDYSSENDEILEVLESSKNYFTYIQLVEYINLLEQFNMDYSAIISDEPMHSKFSSKDEFLKESMTLEEFKSFVVNKILTLEDLSDLSGKNSTVIFQKFCIEMYESLELKLKEHYKNNNSFSFVKKRNLLAFGILFCSCENIEKIKLFFDVFKKENEDIFCKSDDLDDFLITMFLISSYCLITTRFNISDEKSEIKKIDKEDISNLLKCSELKDCQNLVKIFNDTFFAKKESYNWSEFKTLFEDIDNGFGWVLSSKGIRRKLEENADKTE